MNIPNAKALLRVGRRRARFLGRGAQDPICGRHFRRFADGPRGRPEALCPGCGSAERHRVLWLYLEQHGLAQADRILHVSPEKGIASRLRSRSHGTYVSVDLEPGLAMVAADLTSLPFGDRSFDLVLCAHVLEHIPEDRKAMAELWRVLAPGGTLVMQHPIDGERPETFEDWTLTTPEARERVFFQRDHLRIYGADFVDRLSQAGIHGIVTTKHQRALAGEDVRRFRLTQEPSQIPERDIEADVIYAARREGDA